MRTGAVSLGDPADFGRERPTAIEHPSGRPHGVDVRVAGPDAGDERDDGNVQRSAASRVGLWIEQREIRPPRIGQELHRGRLLPPELDQREPFVTVRRANDRHGADRFDRGSAGIAAAAGQVGAFVNSA